MPGRSACWRTSNRRRRCVWPPRSRTASPKVVGLQIGWADLLEPLNVDRDNRAAIESILLTVRLAAGEAGIWAYDGAYPNIADPDGYRREAEAARRLGFIGKSAIHPSQVPIANAVFQPTPDEITHALKVVEAAQRGRSPMASARITVDEQMVDAPFVRRAEAVVALARQLGMVRRRSEPHGSDRSDLSASRPRVQPRTVSGSRPAGSLRPVSDAHHPICHHRYLVLTL